MSGEALRAKGMAQVAFTFDSPGDDWATRARQWIESCPRGQMLDADDLRAAVGTPFHANATGQVFFRAAKDDVIQPIGYRQSERDARRRGVVRIWERL
jgi:hypothetical protein